jgi:hypothetical protein
MPPLDKQNSIENVKEKAVHRLQLRCGFEPSWSGEFFVKALAGVSLKEFTKRNTKNKNTCEV